MKKERILESAKYHIKKGQKIYVKPNIPQYKLDSAITSYASEVNRDDVLVLLDTTVFGSGKEGLVATAEGLYWKPEDKSKPPSFFPFSELKDLNAYGTRFKGHITLNKEVIIYLTIPFKAIMLLYNFLDSVRLMVVEERKKSAAEDSKQAGLWSGIDPQATYFGKGGLLGEERISELLHSLVSPGALTSQLDLAVKTKKKEAKGLVGGGFISIIVGTILGIYGFIGYFVTPLPLRAIITFAVPFAVIGGIIMMLKGTAKAAVASKTQLITSIEDTCKEYYNNLFCKFFDKSVDAYNITNWFPGLFPAQVYDDYESPGWQVFQSVASPGTTSSSMTCSVCKKQADFVESSNISIPLENDNLTKSIFLKCTHCQGIVCYECLINMEPHESVLLCTTCGRSTNGAKGLVGRWLLYRLKHSDTESNFDLHRAEINLRPRSDSRVQDVDITLYGSPFSEVKFRNISFNIDGNWFLATPEPVVGS